MGEVVGQYELKEVLGGGGMATVYRGEHVSGIGMTAAIKKLHPHLSIDTKLRARLRVEAQALVRLHHPNIVRILDFVEEEEFCALVVELVDGRTLRALMNDYPDGPMPIALALLIFRQVLVAVDHAHKQGCLHRDIKPANIMVDSDNHVKVLDFGIASLVDQDQLTQPGMSLGTPVYMAPEAIRDGMEALDPRADVYALGVTFWEVLAGKGARPIGLRGWRLEPERVDDLAEHNVTEGVIEVLKGMIALDVNERLGSCQMVLQSLNWAVEESAETAVFPRLLVAPAERPAPVPKPSLVLASELPSEPLQKDAPIIAELTRAPVPAPTKEPTLAKKKKRRKRAQEKAARQSRLWLGAAGAALCITGILWLALRGPSLGSGDPATFGALKTLPEMVVFDRSAFFYGPEDRKVVLSAFALGRTEVTVEAYGRCVAAGTCPNRTGEYVGSSPSGTSPMEHVDWMQASTYCEWRYRNADLPSDYGSRLPTDAEWERAARGPGDPGRTFPLGMSLPGDLASAGAAQAPAVGSTTADVTPEGVADLTASVAEWVFDAGPEDVDEEAIWAGYPSDATSNPAAAPAVRTKGTRAVRGSSYLQHPSMDRYFRSTARVWMTGTRSGSGRGFRCAVGPKVTP